MNFQLRKAERKQAKMRIGLSGPSGSGKTYSALLLAYGITGDWSKICLIDSENGRGEIYSDLGDYNYGKLQAPFSPESYIAAIRSAESAGMEVIIVDSITHEWDGEGGCLEINERLAQTKFKGNTWAAWSETTPRHQKFINAITHSSSHVITTVRNKVETVQTDDKKIKKVGTKEITREGFEYELTVNFNIDREGHYVTASKDNTKLFDARDPFIITAETGVELREWNESGAVDHTAVKKRINQSIREICTASRRVPPKTANELAADVKKLTGLELAPENYQQIDLLSISASEWSDNPLPADQEEEIETIHVDEDEPKEQQESLAADDIPFPEADDKEKTASKKKKNA